MSYRLVYNNLSNAAHNTMRPLKSKGVHCIKIRVISQVNTPLPSPGRGCLVCALRARRQTGRRTAVREKQSGGLFFSPRVLPPSPSRRRKRHIACGDFFAKVTSRSFCCASFSPQNLAARFFAGPRFPSPGRGCLLGAHFTAVHSPRSCL